MLNNLSFGMPRIGKLILSIIGLVIAAGLAIEALGSIGSPKEFLGSLLLAAAFALPSGFWLYYERADRRSVTTSQPQ